MVQAIIEKLPAYVHYYVKRVIGLNVILNDSPQPCSINTEKPIIELPMTQETLGIFLGEEFVEHAPVELLFSIVIGLAYHEAAHIMSGEKHVEPHLLDNIINDSNDFTFVPKQWKGSMPFTLSLINTTYQQGMDFKDLPINTCEEKLQALIHLSVTYMRKLRINNNGKDIRNLPQNHELTPYFEQIKTIMRITRKAPIKNRPSLVTKLYKVLKDFWDNITQNKPQQQLLEEALSTAQPEIRIELTSEDVKKLKQTLEKLGTMKKIAGELKRTANAVVIIEKREEGKKDAEAKKRIQNLGDIGSKITPEEPVIRAKPLHVDKELARKLKLALKPLLFERSLIRRKPSVVGTTFAPSRFHEIKTQPENPRIRKNIRRTGKACVETEIILCFDRSGSMRGDKEEVCKEVAGTFYTAIETIPQAKIQILGFDNEINLIKGKGNTGSTNTLSKIASGLSARGGTDFPLALYQALTIIEKSRAHKKIIFMLTDGDVNGTLNIEDLLRYAKHLNTNLITIGITGSDETMLRETLGKDNVIYIEDIHTLPNVLRKKAQCVM
ncbi:VWA domain-containing protein [Candidatus Latescibacterota bacterium]